MGTWAPAKPSTASKDFAALAYLLHPNDPQYLREFISAKRGGPFGWEDQDTPYRPYLTRERVALERLAALTTLTVDEQARLADLQMSKWSETYAEPTSLGGLLSEYRDNEVRADGKFKAKVISFTGTVTDVKQGEIGGITVNLGTGKPFETPHVHCFVADDQAKKVAALSRGQKVTMKGKVQGLMIDVLVQNCELQN